MGIVGIAGAEALVYEMSQYVNSPKVGCSPASTYNVSLNSSTFLIDSFAPVGFTCT